MNSNKVNYSRSRFWIIVIAIMGALLYLQTYDYEYTVDDVIYTTANSVTKKGLEKWSELFKYGSYYFVKTESSINSGTYRPLTLLTFAAEKELFGEFSSTNGHLINIFLYFFNLLFIGWVLFKLIEHRKLPIVLSFLMLALFAFHPIHTEVVASIKSRDTLLAAFFTFAALSIWMQNADKGIGILKKIIISLLFFLGLLSKEEGITFVAVIGLMSYFILKKSIGQSLKSTLVFLIPAVVYLIVRQVILDTPVIANDFYINSVLYAADQKQFLATNLFIYLQYLKLLALPHPLSWDYSFNQIPLKDFTNIWVWISILVFASIVYISIKGFKKRSFISFSLLFYLITFSIFANLTRSLIIGSTLGERFLYLPSLAFSMLFVYIVYIAFQKLKIKKIILSLLLVFIPISAAFAIKSYSRSKVWQSKISLFESGIKTSSESWRTNYFYGKELGRLALELSKENSISKDSLHHLFSLSIKSLEKGFSIINYKPRIPQHELVLCKAYLDYGDTLNLNKMMNKMEKKYPKNYIVLEKLSFLSNKVNDLERVIKYNQMVLLSKNPNLFFAYKNLGIAYQKLQKTEDAISAFEKALKQINDKDSLNIKAALASLYFKIGDVEKAKHLNPVKYNSVVIEFLSSLKKANESSINNDYKNAVTYFKKAELLLEENGGSEKYPTFYKVYANSVLKTGNTHKAKELFLKALESNSKDSYVLRNLGFIAFHTNKNYSQAEKYFYKCIEYSPQKTFVDYVNLGAVLAIQKKETQAIKAYEKALKYGSSKEVIQNLYLLYKAIGDESKMRYYQSLLKS